MTRLTKQMKKDALEAILKDKFKSKIEALNNKLVEHCKNAILNDPEHIKAQEQYKDLVPCIKKHIRYVDSNITLYYQDKPLKNALNSKDMLASVPNTLFRSYSIFAPYSTYINIGKDSFISSYYFDAKDKFILQFFEEYYALVKEINGMYFKLDMAFSSITTVKKLKDNMPNLVKYFGIQSNSSTTLVPVALYSELNNKFS